MNRHLSLLFTGTVSLLLFGCATGYKKIQPSKINYLPNASINNIEIDFEKNLLQGKYAENEHKTGTTLVGVKIINNGTADVDASKDLKIYMGQKELNSIRLNNFYELTRQNADKSLLFLLMAPVNIYTSSQTTSGNQVTSSKSHFYPVGIILGPLLAFTNKGRADAANRKFQKDLDDNDLSKKIIHPGETAYGFIALNANAMEPFTIRAIK
jgi:hypothetical protein